MAVNKRNIGSLIGAWILGSISLLLAPADKAFSEDSPPTSSRKGASAAEKAKRDDSAKEADEATAKPRTLTLSTDQVRSCKAATALVDLGQRGSGSATCVSTDGLFVTNHHVVGRVTPGENVPLVIHPGQEAERVLKAKIIKLDEENDLALLKVDAPPKLTALSLGSDADLVETAPLTAFGYPFGLMLASGDGYPSISVNMGTVTALRRKGRDLSVIQLDAAVNPGNSGGPVIDDKGQLIGIIVSGLPGARVNFAIAVNRVRKFLAEPALVLRRPHITFFERTKPRQFEIDAYALDRRVLDELLVELTLSGSGDEPRTFKAKRVEDRFVVEGAACAPEAVPPKAVLAVRKGRGRIETEVPTGELTLGSRKFPWMDVRSLAKDDGEWILTTMSSERYAGTAKGLPSAHWGNGHVTQLATADELEVRIDQEPQTAVEYQLQASRGQDVFTPVRGEIPIEARPEPLKLNFDRPIFRSDIRLPVVIEAVVPEALKFQISALGLLWPAQSGAAPGMEDERGRFILINGQPWYMEQATPRRALENGEQLPLLPFYFGGRIPQVHLLWARGDSDSPHDGERVAVEVQKGSAETPFGVTVKNRASQPTRVSLAITFDPIAQIYPLLPPRTQPVLESHWPLNDEDPTRAADVGPAKRSGRTSIPHTVPGARGKGIEMERASILCPDVLAIDRNDPFSTVSWIKARTGESGSAASRMNIGLRGFDLGYGGSVQSHLISSWDGNALRVNTMEKFDATAWHQIAVTYDGSSRARGLKVYIDGALATMEITHDRLSDTIRSDFPFTIGSREHRDHFQGRIDEVRTYDRVLSEEEIFELYDLDRSDLSPARGSSLNQGLTGYWSFDGAANETFQDKSGRGHHGQLEIDLNRPKVVVSDGGQALRLEGEAFVDCGRVANFERTDSFSMGVWFKPRGGFSTLLSTSDPEVRGIDLSFDGHVICHFVSQWEGNAIRIATKDTYPNDVWHHAVCTYDGSSKGSGFKIYVDGAEVPLEVSHDSLNKSTSFHGHFRIGSRQGRDYFTGDLDDVFVYRRTLSPAEARSLFTRGRTSTAALSQGVQQGLVGAWTFDGKDDEAYRDRSGQKHHGLPDVRSAHSRILPLGSTRVAYFRGLGGIHCDSAGDFERTDAFSAGGWFQWERGSIQALLSKLILSGPQRGYELRFNNDSLNVHLTHNWDFGPQNSISVETEPYLETGWQHVFMTYDGSSRASGVRIYVNGNSQPLKVVADSLTKSIRVDEPFVIGSRYAGLTLQGYASHVRVFPRVLTGEEIRQLANTDKPAASTP